MNKSSFNERILQELYYSKKNEAAKIIVAMHEQGKSFDSIAKILNVNRTSLTRLLDKNNIEYHIPLRKRPKGLFEYSLTALQRSILIGEMFGDGNLCRSSNKAAYYQCSHCKDQELFVQWKYDVFLPLSCRMRPFKIKDKRSGTESGAISMATWSNAELKNWRDQFYPSGQGNKQPSAELAELLDPLGLAVWFMGDGSKEKNKGKYTVGKQINVAPIVQVLNRKFGNIFYLRDDDKQWSICIKDADKFFNLIGQYIIPSMKYKIPFKFLHYEY